MSLLEQIGAKRLEYRKKGIKQPMFKVSATTLTTLYGEAAIIGKNNNRQTTDDEVVKVIQKFIKGVEDNKKYRELSEAEIIEVTLYRSFLPTMISEEAIRHYTEGYIRTVEDPLTMKLMGIIITELKADFPGQVDGKVASAIIKSILLNEGV